MNQKELFEMGLHETENIAQGYVVARVLGGWIYYTYNYDGGAIETACFVPEPNHIADAGEMVPDISVESPIEVRQVIDDMDSTVRNFQTVDLIKLIIEMKVCLQNCFAEDDDLTDLAFEESQRLIVLVDDFLEGKKEGIYERD